jgi:hypothetical protein
MNCISRRRTVVAIGVCCVVGLSMATLARAATFSYTQASVTYTVAEADAFLSGGSAGNTVNMDNPGQFWAQNTGGNQNGLYNWRDFASLWFNAPAGTVASDRDTFEVSNQPQGVPNLRTTINGLASRDYEVYLVHLVRTDGNHAANASLRADIDTGQAAPATLQDELSPGIVITPFTGSVFAVALQPLGQITGTSFSVLVGPTSIPYVSGVRGDYIGVAFAAVPEPSVIGLAAFSVLGLSACGWRKRRGA